MKPSFLLIVALAFPQAGPGEDGTRFRRDSKFSAVRMSYDDLDRLIVSIRQLVGVAPGEKCLDEQLSLRDRIASVEFSGAYSKDMLRQGPPVADSVEYELKCADRLVSSVELLFYEHDRHIRLEGPSRDHVDALQASLTSKVGQFETHLGGSVIRAWGGFLLFLFAIGLLNGSSFAKSKRLRVAMLFSAPVCVGLILLLPWQSWLPGVAVYAGDASFFVRHGPLLTFVGTAAGIISLAVALAQAIRVANKPGSATAAATSQPSTAANPRKDELL